MLEIYKIYFMQVPKYLLIGRLITKYARINAEISFSVYPNTLWVNTCATEQIYELTEYLFQPYSLELLSHAYKNKQVIAQW